MLANQFGMKGFIGAMGALMFNRSAPPSAKLDAEPAAASELTTRVTILAIDDDATMLDLLRPLLKTEGFNVLTAQSGAKGLDMLRYAQKDVRVVLLDYNMPRLSGADTLNYVRKLAPHVKVVAITGVEETLLPESYRSQVDRFLPKPFRASDLVGCVRELLQPPVGAPQAA
jgi:CheY-like chemotaxis protein